VKFLILGTGTSRNKILKGSQNQIWRCSLDGSRDENQPLDGRQEQAKQGERWGKRGEWRIDRSKAVGKPEQTEWEPKENTTRNHYSDQMLNKI
jgi:hypothetical protein